LTAEELDEVETMLASIAQGGEAGLSDSDEDVHTAIERLLGDVGRKIHAGRSRNDQVVAALRLYVLDACAEAREGIDAFAFVVLSFAESEADTVMPGYTHLQRAQAVTLGHHLLAWVEMLDRDRSRFAAAAEAASASPLGAGALAGSTLELPPPAGQLRNSIDAVGDRDFALDYLYAAAVLYSHLSRIGEEIALWATSEFGFVRLPESASTGSRKLRPTRCSSPPTPPKRSSARGCRFATRTRRLPARSGPARSGSPVAPSSDRPRARVGSARRSRTPAAASPTTSEE
jgi:argininosuccinate lyase